MKRLFLLSLGLLFSLSGFAAAPATDRPNIVLIITDDQGYGDLGITGNPVLDTPNIDALARGGATMTKFYVSPVCSPTRASLMSGRYNYRTRVVDTFKGRSMMDPGEVTVAEVLRGAGYATGIFGKWHLGDNYPLRATDQGFEKALVLRGGGLAQPSEPIENGNRYTDPILFHNNQQVQTKGYCTDVYFDAAMRYMDTAHSGRRPFFAYIACNAPHDPLHDVPEALYAKYKAKDLSPALLGNTRSADSVARVYAMVENIDQNVGRLMAHLRSTKLLTNTLVVFMSDNGPAGQRYVGDMRGQKSQVHDGGIRSPFYAHWPARLKAGTRSDRIAAHIDVMPTLLEAASVPLPTGLKLDGRSLLPLLEGKPADWPDRTLVLQTHRGDVPIPFHNLAIRDQRWKLVHPSGFGRETMPTDVPLELYDLDSDSMEARNLAAEQPDVVKRLSAAYDAWFRDVSTTRPDNFAPPRIVIGTDHETTTVLTWQDWRVTEPQGWGHNGIWKLSAAQDAVYDIELRWPKPVDPAEVRIRAGATRQTLTLKEPTATAELKGVPITKGDLDLNVVLLRDGKREDPYHVILKRVALGKK
jgi:arylsulfatase/arylsulfatase A